MTRRSCNLALSFALAIVLGAASVVGAVTVEEEIYCRPFTVAQNDIYVVTVTNFSEESRSIDIDFYDTAGALVRSEPFTLASFASVGQGYKHTGASLETLSAVVRVEGTRSNYAVASGYRGPTGSDLRFALPCKDG